MAIYEFTPTHFQSLKPVSFAEASVREREDIQRLLRAQIEILDDELLVISEEFCEWEDSRRRIDLLAIDRQANLVVIELKRTEDGGHMELQALRYAAMVSTMTFEKVTEVFGRHLSQTGQSEDPQKRLLEFLEWDQPNEELFAQDVRIMLVSADFGKELTSTVMWLNQRDIDIRCIRLSPYSDGERIFVDIQQVIPLPEALDYQVRIREKAKKERQATGQQWDRSSLLRALKETRGSVVASVAEELLDWVAPRVSYIWWGQGKQKGTYVPMLIMGSENGSRGRYQLFFVHSSGYLSIWPDTLAKKYGMEDGAAIEELRQSLDQIEGWSWEIQDTRRKFFPLEALSNPESLAIFKAAMGHLIDHIHRSFQSSSISDSQ